MINLAEKYVMMIEPDKEGEKAENPVEDNLSLAMEQLLNMCDFSAFRTKGIHITKCGKWSDNKDWILPGGQTTNSLALYYLQYYRPYIPPSEIDKVKLLAKNYLKIEL